ncbi:MAG: nucleoside hydrolase, partial [Planctomycetaceae bacterium]|nr:nucleoside hydrolase [Planctomycetaceae bacterium]
MSEGQAESISLLNRVRPDRPKPLFLLTDPNKDPDDLCALVLIRSLQEQRFVDLRCVLVTLGDLTMRTRRARFARSVLSALGLQDIPVGVGIDYIVEVRDAHGNIDSAATEKRRVEHQVFVETSLDGPDACVEIDGLSLICRELQRIDDHSAVLLINAGMPDVAALLKTDSALVKQKCSKVVIMGGVESEPDARGFAVADRRAYNNLMHQESADYTYAQLQELRIPLVVVTKEAAYAAAAPRDFYDDIGDTGHPIGISLKDQQMRAMQHLWEGIHAGRLPPALTPKWFFTTFTDVDLETSAGQAVFDTAGKNALSFGEIWRLVTKFNLYDPLALLAATPGVDELLFRPQVPEGVVTNVRVLGMNEIRDAVLVSNLFGALALESLNSVLPLKTRTDDQTPQT